MTAVPSRAQTAPDTVDTSQAAAMMVTFRIDDLMPSGELRIAPLMMTEDQAAQYCRLDRDGAADPGRTLRDLCKQYCVKTMMVRKTRLYPRAELRRMMREIWKEQNPKDPYPGDSDEHIVAIPISRSTGKAAKDGK